MKNLVETAVEAGNFKTLVKAVQEAGLVDTLSDEGPFTVFAPTDEAFSKLPEGTIENLLKDREKLTEILTYHVVPKKVMSEEVVKLRNAQTVNGKEIT
ncbi:MAG: fasciclin domain-containing protein, partial [Thermoplasmatales archaeon]